jgi:uncharacterized membrane protein
MKTPKAGAGFRRHLKNHLPLLQTDGLITADQARDISQRYRLNDLAAESTHALLMAIYIIGAFLIGIGVISFVAAHWTAIPRQVKVALLFAAMIASHLAGFYLWKMTGKSSRLGHALTILGTFIFGASIGLMAQIFHVTGSATGLFGPWAIGAIVMAYTLGSTPNAVIAIVTSFVWFTGRIGWGELTYWYYPFAAAALFLPYCYWRKSTFAFTLTLLAVGLGTILACGNMPGNEFFVPMSIIAIGILYACWGLIAIEGANFKSFGSPAIFLGYVAVSIPVYLCSFREVAEDMLYADNALGRDSFPQALPALAAFVIAMLLVTPAILRSRHNAALTKVFSVVMVTFGLYLIGSISGSQFIFAGLANIALLALAVVLIWIARDLGDRRLFWSGIIMVALMVVSRSFEYETGLIIKAIAFTAGGVAVIVAGVVFEKFLKARRIINE